MLLPPAATLGTTAPRDILGGLYGTDLIWVGLLREGVDTFYFINNIIMMHYIVFQ